MLFHEESQDVLSFRDRAEAGRFLARKLSKYRGTGAVVLGIPRGGVPVAFEIARELNLLLDVFIVRKLGVPGQEELAMGAIASGGVRVLNRSVVDSLGLSYGVIEGVSAEQTRELVRREKAYRGDRPFPEVSGRTVILVDDGVATGSSIRVAIQALQRLGPTKIVVAVPVAPASTVALLRHEADEVVCLIEPEQFLAIGQWYEDFQQVTDAEVMDLLGRAQATARVA